MFTLYYCLYILKKSSKEIVIKWECYWNFFITRFLITLKWYLAFSTRRMVLYIQLKRLWLRGLAVNSQERKKPPRNCLISGIFLPPSHILWHRGKKIKGNIKYNTATWTIKLKPKTPTLNKKYEFDYFILYISS